MIRKWIRTAKWVTIKTASQNVKVKNNISVLMVNLISEIKCPECNFRKEEEMPENACVHFYKCKNCGAILRPIIGDCCVFCSYGTIKCPPMQTGMCKNENDNS